MRQRHRSTLLAVAALAALVIAAGACSRRPAPGPGVGSGPGAGSGMQTRTVRYGPFTVPNTNAPGQSPLAALMPLVGLTLDNGMLSVPVTNVEKPCSDCYLTGMHAGLEYADGSDANIDSGMWLHHMVALDQGAGKFDATCRNAMLSLPHLSVGASANNSERFFASGNERTAIDLTRTGQYGYKVNAADRFHLLVELMNMNPTDKTVYLTVEYKYVPGNAAGYRPVKPVWLDVAQCTTSEAPAQTGRYTLRSVPWTSTVSGTLIEGMGHVHDGGTNLTVDRSGQVICDSRASYGTDPAYVEPAGGMDHGGMDHGHGGGQHLSRMTNCPPGSALRAGDVLQLGAHYDSAVHPQMMHDGKPHPIMGIALLYYAQ